MNNKRYDGIDHPVREVTDLKDIINSSCEMFPDVDAYLYKDKKQGKFVGIKYSQVKADVDALGTRFCDMGLKDKKIAVIGETSYYWFLTYYATVCGTGVIVPLDKNLPPEEVKNLVDRAKVSAIVYSKKLEKSVKPLFDNPGTIEFFISMEPEEEDKGANVLSLPTLIEEGAALVYQGARYFIDSEIDPNQMAALLFTSGTTGQSKGVMLSHKNIACNVVNMSRREKLGDGFVILSILPTHHTFENTCVDWTTFYQGKTLAICEGIKYITKNMNEVHANCMVGVPLVFEKIHKGMMKQAESSGQGENLRRAMELSRRLKLYNNPRVMKRMFKSIHDALGGEMQQFIAGGAAIDPQVIKDFEAMGIPMMQGYGMTECSPIIAVNQNNYSIAESVGRPMHGTQVRIEDPDKDGIGEIVCKSPSVMMGYYEDPEATAEVLRDGWLYTGDLGYLDENGFLYVTGRKKTVIVTKGGKNIFPEEIEEVLKQNDLIKEVLVHGVTDKRIGNVAVTADIQPNFALLKERHGEMDSSQIYHFYKDLVDKVNDTMPPYKAIKRVNIREKDFEMTTTGKLKRYGNFTEGEDAAGSLSYREEKAEEKERALELLREIKESDSEYILYKDGEPITDIRDIVNNAANKYGDNIAVGAQAGITYKKLQADVNGLGTALMNRGLKGKKVEILGEGEYEWLVAFLAIISGIGTAVVSNQADVSLKDYDIYALIEEGQNQLAQGDRQYIDSEVLGSDIALIIEGVKYTHTNICQSVMAASSHLAISERDMVLASESMDKIFALVMGVLIPMYRGASLKFAKDMSGYLKNMAVYQPTIGVANEELLKEIYDGLLAKAEAEGRKTRLNVVLNLNRNANKLRVNLGKVLSADVIRVFGGRMEKLIVAGAVEEDVHRFFKGLGIDIIQTYQDVKTTGPVAITSMSSKDARHASKAGAIGHLLPGVGIKITEKDLDGNGEICLAGETIVVEDAEDDGHAIRDTWYHTGDLGHIDEGGFLYVTGKVSDRFVGDGRG